MGRDSLQARKSLTPLNLISIFLLLVPFLLAALYFAGRALESYSYSRRDIRRHFKIIRRTTIASTTSK